MDTLRELFLGADSFGTGPCRCYDNQYRATHHGTEQRYVSPTTGRCKPLIIQAEHPRRRHGDGSCTETRVSEKMPDSRKLAIWLVVHPPSAPHEVFMWLVRWAWFTLALIWPFNVPWYTGFYPPYLSRYYGQLWVARSPREYSLCRDQVTERSVREITHAIYPRQLFIHDPASKSWNICADEKIIKQQKYIAISYPYEENILRGVDKKDQPNKKEAFIEKVKAVVASLGESAFWIDLELIGRTNSPEEVDQDLYRMADVYRGAQFTLIMLCPPDGITEEDSWLRYGERLWTFPEALLSRELRFKFRDGGVTPITLHQLANRAYAGFDRESAIINAYALRDPLERLERLSLLKSALWRRTSRRLQEAKEKPDSQTSFRADRVYALMGFFEHRIHPHHLETELQALVRLSMANDNDRLVERMVSLLPSQIPNTAGWYAEEDGWRANLWDIEPDIQVVGMTESQALVLGGCRAAAIRWKDFPSVAFAVQTVGRIIANYLPNLFWELLIIGIILEASFGPSSPVQLPGVEAPLIIALILMLFAPLLVAYGTSGRTVRAQPWLVGVKGLISAEEASTLMYGGSVFALPKTCYSPSGTLLSETERGPFRRGDPEQLEALRTGGGETDDLYTLIDTLSTTLYYFRAARPPTVCLYTGRESGMGRFLLCSERCTKNVLHKEAVIRMPWYISQSMSACDWVALG